MDDKKNIVILVLLFILFLRKKCLCDVDINDSKVKEKIVYTPDSEKELLDIEYIERSTDTNNAY